MSPRAAAVRFLVLTFIFTWSFCVLGFLLRERALVVRWPTSTWELPYFYLFIWVGGLGPGIAALILSEEKEEPTGLWARLTRWRVGWVSYLIALVLPVGMSVFAIIMYGLTGGTLLPPDSTPLWLLDMLAITVLAPFWEELGWRGFLLPKLLRMGSAFRASLLIGIAWGLWHLPVRWHTGPPDVSPLFFFLVFWANVVGVSFAFTWLFQRTQGALLPCMILHAAFNASMACFIAPTTGFFGIGLLLWLTLAVWFAALFLYRLRNFDKEAAEPVGNVYPA